MCLSHLLDLSGCSYLQQDLKQYRFMEITSLWSDQWVLVGEPDEDPCQNMCWFSPTKASTPLSMLPPASCILSSTVLLSHRRQALNSFVLGMQEISREKCKSKLICEIALLGWCSVLLWSPVKSDRCTKIEIENSIVIKAILLVCIYNELSYVTRLFLFCDKLNSLWRSLTVVFWQRATQSSYGWTHACEVVWEAWICTTITVRRCF